ncbi:uncharacterized protein TNCV_1418231 [Trichonephila clavipes]|nr:uncharacterized protein TNCV_1418231 [Trichonephila clavipes]
MQIFSTSVHHVIAFIRALKVLTRVDSCCFKSKFYRKDLIDELKIFGRSSRHHIDDFMRDRIIGKIEEGRKITDVAREFDIAHSAVSRLWKSFKTSGMCSRRHGEVVLEVRRLQKTDISSYQQKGTGAPQLSRWQESPFRQLIKKIHF